MILLAPGKRRCGDMVPTVRHLCSKSRPPDQESRPHAPVQCWGPVWKDSHRCGRPLPMKRPRKPLPPHSYGLFYKVARGLCYSRPRGLDSGGRPSYQFILPLRDTPRITQWPGLQHWVSSATGDFTTPGSEHDAHHPPAPAVGWHGGTVHQDGRGTLVEGRHIQPEGLGCYATPFSTGLSGIHARYHRLHPGKLVIRKRAPTAQRSTVRDTPRQGAANNRACGKFGGPSAW
jgi:hypothetical protein